MVRYGLHALTTKLLYLRAVWLRVQLDYTHFHKPDFSKLSTAHFARPLGTDVERMYCTRPKAHGGL